MAYTTNDLSTFKASGGHFYYAPVGTVRPKGVDALLNPPAPWKPFGNTSVENIVGLTAEGGERTTLASLQKASLREDVSPISQSFTINLLEWTGEIFKFYYGSNVVVEEDKAIRVPEKPQPMEVALLVVLEDGESLTGFYAAKASIYRDSDLDIANTTDLNVIPIKATAITVDDGGTPSPFTAIPKLFKKRSASGQVAVDEDGSLSAAFVTDGGAGYTAAPEVTVVGAGSGAVVTAKVSNGVVVELAVDPSKAGTGYDAETTLSIAAPTA